MYERIAMLRAVAAAPEDDLPRLIFADWLEENGDPGRAEFVRVQVDRRRLRPADPRQASLKRREKLLLRKHGERWRGELPKWPPAGTPSWWTQSDFGPHERGFVTAATVRELAFLDAVAAAWDEYPLIDDLHFELESDDLLRELARTEYRPRVRAVTFESEIVSDKAFDNFARSPHLRFLEGLRFRALGTSTKALFKSLIKAGVLRGLRHVGLGYSGVRSHELRLLFNERYYPELHSLDLATAGGEEGLDPLVPLARADTPSLRRLDLTGASLTPGGLEEFLYSGNADSLKVLELGGVFFQSGTAEVLSEAYSLAGLEVLDLSQTQLGRADRARLIGSPSLGSLRELDLSATGLDDGDAELIADRARLPELRVLNLSANEIGPGGARALAESPNLASLERLILEDNPCTVDG